jgi:hypothetical protein
VTQGVIHDRRSTQIAEGAATMDLDRDAIIDADEMLIVDPHGWAWDERPAMARAGAASRQDEDLDRDRRRADRGLLADDDSE